MNYLKCPKSNGGCGKQDNFNIAISRTADRLIIDCNCGYRFSVPIRNEDLKKYTGPIDATGEKVKRE